MRLWRNWNDKHLNVKAASLLRTFFSTEVHVSWAYWPITRRALLGLENILATYISFLIQFNWETKFINWSTKRMRQTQLNLNLHCGQMLHYAALTKKKSNTLQRGERRCGEQNLNLLSGMSFCDCLSFLQNICENIFPAIEKRMSLRENGAPSVVNNQYSVHLNCFCGVVK